jgi:nitrogen fixation/metabolism regulation signal transduction histidine kinase
MQTLKDNNKPTLHEIIQPLNIIGLSCGAVRARFSDHSSDDAKYIIEKMARIEEQVIRATELITELKQNDEEDRAAGGN